MSPITASSPTSASADARHTVRAHLAAALRMFAELDFDEGAAGHLSVRDPYDADLFWINPDGLPFELATASSVVLVNAAGDVIEGSHGPNRAGQHLHAAVYAARPDVVSAMHAHPVATKAWSSLRRLLDPINQEVCIFYGCHSLFDEYMGPFSDESESAKIADALGADNIAVILRNHGLLTVGASVGSAAYRFKMFDRSVRVQMAAEALGRPAQIDHAVASALAVSEGHCEHGFLPIYTSIRTRHPEVDS